ncbi:MAG: 6-carboxytetrahydropterin synthase QueD [Methanogenium sp.]|jgi:6-pyruvoyltetrahydropterin/6-carboxytetrahydropterin synthase
MKNKKNLITKEQLQNCIDKKMTLKKIAECNNCPIYIIRNIAKKYGIKFLGSSFFNKGKNNPSKRPDVRKQISNTVSKRWVEGNYDKRINGMTNVLGEKHPNWNKEKHEPLHLAENKYVSFLSKYQDVKKCVRCKSTTNKMNVHHIDEDHSNFLPSNLEPLCVACHTAFHYKYQKQPFITVGKIMTFASAHRLPAHKGLCNRWHGHEWEIEVKVEKRIDKKTGMVVDFSILKKAMQQSIIDVLDHSVLNDFIKNPTAENIAVWCWERLMFDSLLKGISAVIIRETKGSVVYLTKKQMLSIFSENIESYILRGKRKQKDDNPSD